MVEVEKKFSIPPATISACGVYGGGKMTHADVLLIVEALKSIGAGVGIIAGLLVIRILFCK